MSKWKIKQEKDDNTIFIYNKPAKILHHGKCIKYLFPLHQARQSCFLLDNENKRLVS